MTTTKEPTVEEQLEQLHADYSALSAEHIRLTDIHMRMLRDERQSEDDTRTSLRRVAERRVHQLAENAYRRLTSSDWTLIDLCMAIPDDGRLPKVNALGIRSVAVRINAVRKNEPTPGFHDEQQAEIDRLREFITIEGQRLHRLYGGDRRCECPGCELIRGMDRVEPADEAAAS